MWPEGLVIRGDMVGDRFYFGSYQWNLFFGFLFIVSEERKYISS